MNNESIRSADLSQQIARAVGGGDHESGQGLLHRELSYAINGAAIQVHKHIGPGQLEAVYERALCEELGMQGIAYERQKPVKAMYKGRLVGEYDADVVVEAKVVVELKVVAKILPVHKQQVLTYLRAAGLRLGLIMNFNAPVLWREIKRVVH